MNKHVFHSKILSERNIKDQRFWSVRKKAFRQVFPLNDVNKKYFEQKVWKVGVGNNYRNIIG